MTSRVKLFLLHPDRNIGGGEVAARALATVMLCAFVIIVLLQKNAPFPLVKIALLTGSELGLLALMFGMLLRTHTHFSGLQLFLACMCMLASDKNGFPKTAAGIGLVFVALGIVEIITRRSWLNSLLQVSSRRESKAP
jgi:hypothetical protein